MKFNFDDYLNNRYKDDPKYKEIMDLMNSEQEKIANEFLSSRISKGLSQKTAAERLNITLDKYIRIESGASDMRMPVLKEYLNRLNNRKNSLFTTLNLSISYSDDMDGVESNEIVEKDYISLEKISTFNV